MGPVGSDVEPAASYFRFVPDLPPGRYTNPHIGMVEPGQVYEVRAQDAGMFRGHPHWEKAAKKDYDAQQKES